MIELTPKELIIELFEKCPKKQLNRKEICEKTNLAWTTAYDNLEKLMKTGKVKRRQYHTGKRGRPKILWRWVK